MNPGLLVIPMKVSAINCPNCGAGIHVEQRVALAVCGHCQTSVTIEWPESQLRRYVVAGAGNPFVTCPSCSCQQLHSSDLAEQEVACPDCGCLAWMPPLAEQQMIVCGVCGRAYSSFERRCPDYDLHPH